MQRNDGKMKCSEGPQPNSQMPVLKSQLASEDQIPSWPAWTTLGPQTLPLIHWLGQDASLA